MGQSWLRTEEDLIHIMRLYLSPPVIGRAPCLCRARWRIPHPIACW